MRWLLTVLMAFLLIACEKHNYVTLSNGRDSLKVNVELARTPEEITRGLMYRTSLGKNSGMLFIFEEESQRVFWMKNTKIPLDMIFINSNGTVVHIEQAVPCTTANCPLYPSIYPAKYVLEVNANFSLENKIEVGSKINLENI